MILSAIKLTSSSSEIIEDVMKDHLAGQLPGHRVAVADYYFDFSNAMSTSVESLLCSLVAQLALQSTSIPNGLLNLYNNKCHAPSIWHRRHRPAGQPSITELSQVLDETLSDFSSVFIIIDALDECSERGKLLQIMGGSTYKET